MSSPGPFPIKKSSEQPNSSSSTPPPPPPTSSLNTHYTRPQPFAPPPCLSFLTSWIPFSADPNYQVCLIAFGLGSIFSISLLLALPLLPLVSSTSEWIPKALQGADPAFAAYLVAWAIFHMCEYMVTSLWNPSKVSVDSFLLNNGHSYHVAHLVGILEYILETRYFPSTSSSSFYFLTFIRRRQWIRYLGLLLVVGGQIVRSLAMIHASHSFSHHIAYKKKDDHSLVTTGIYAYSRHPSYAGFFWWAVGTQLLLGNSFATFAFALFLWRWFFARIGEEERLLVRFFGDEYVKYREKVLSGLPLLR